MGMFFVLIVVKLLDIAAIASLFVGLFKVRNAIGYPVAVALAFLGHIVLRSTQITGTTWDALEFTSIAAGLIAACLAFFIGKALRRDIQH